MWRTSKTKLQTSPHTNFFLHAGVEEVGRIFISAAGGFDEPLECTEAILCRVDVGVVLLKKMLT